MIDCDAASDAHLGNTVNLNVAGLVPAVALGTNMLGLASATTREYSNAVNQQQLNQIAALSAVTQYLGGPRAGRGDLAGNEAMALLRQALAAIQAN